MAFPNVTFTGNIYNELSSQFSGTEVKYQLYFHKVNNASSSSTWSSTRLSEYGQYNINLGDSDILTQDGNYNPDDDIILLFWTPNTSIRSDINLTEWGYINLTLTEQSLYIYDVQLKGPSAPYADFSVTGATTINNNVVITDVASHDRHEWVYNTVTMYQEPSRYGQPLFYGMNTLPADSIDITWDDGVFSNNQDPAQSYLHQYTSSNNYSITAQVTNTSGLSDSQIFMWTIYNNQPEVNFTIDVIEPYPDGISGRGEKVTFTNTTTDPDNKAITDGWTWDWSIEDTTNSITYDGQDFNYSPDHKFSSPGNHNITLRLHWYDGTEWTTSFITKSIDQQVWSVANGLTWTTPVYANHEITFTPSVSGDTNRITTVYYYLDGQGIYSLNYNQGFYYVLFVSKTYLMRQDILYNNGFTNQTQSETYTIIMSPIADFIVSDDVCGDLYTDDSTAGLLPITMYKWKVYLENYEIASLEGANRTSFEYNWPTIGNFKVLHSITDSNNNTHTVIKSYYVNSCKGGSGGGGNYNGNNAGTGAIIVEKPLPKFNAELMYELVPEVNIVATLISE